MWWKTNFSLHRLMLFIFNILFCQEIKGNIKFYLLKLKKNHLTAQDDPWGEGNNNRYKTGRWLPRKTFLIYLFWKKSVIDMHDVTFSTDRRAFRINLTTGFGHGIFTEILNPIQEFLLKMKTLRVGTSSTSLIWKCPPRGRL